MDSSTLTQVLESPEVQAFATGFPTTLAHLAVTLGLLGAGAVIYALLTPWKEIALIREGNAAASVAFAGVLVGLAVPLAVSLSVSSSVRDIVNRAGYASPVRTPRGRDIFAACGQLKSESEKVRASALRKAAVGAVEAA